jgi:hypothetical protein
VQAASVLSLRTANQERALHEFAALASAHVAGCTAASVALWGDGEIALEAASHPDATRLTRLQLDRGCGPLVEVLANRLPVHCPDTMSEPRWPEYAAAAVRLGVRCSTTLSAGDQQAVVLTLLGARPRSMDLSQLLVAELVAAFSAAVVGAVADYHESVRTNVQLQGAAEGRALVDQAKGILMHALSCSADEALARITDVSQRSNLRATEVAARVIESQAGQRGSAGPPLRAGADR